MTSQRRGQGQGRPTGPDDPRYEGDGGGNGNGGNGGGTTPPPTPPPVIPPPLLPPQAYTPGQDLFFGNSQVSSPPLDRRQNHFRTFQTQFEDVVGFEVLLQDLSGGLGVVTGPFSQFNDRATKSTNDTRVPGLLRLNPITSVQTTSDAETGKPLSHCEVANTLFVAQGGTTNASLHWMTAGFAITPITYNPTGVITNLNPIVIGGATTAQQVAISSDGGAVQILDATLATVTGTMHANTNPCWGILQTFLSTQTMLIYAGGLIYTLPASAAIGDAPTSTGTVLQNGGYTISIKKLGDAPYRAFFVVPATPSGAASIQAGAAAVGGTPPQIGIVHTNLEGTDPQQMKLAITYVKAVCEIEQGYVVSDGTEVWLHTGMDQRSNLFFSRGREPVSNRDNHVQTLWGLEDRLFAQVVQRSDSQIEAWWIEEFDFRSRQWHQITLTTTTNDNFELAVGRSAPVSHLHRRIWAHSTTQWQRVHIAPQAMDPYELSRSGFIDYQFAATGSTETPAWLLPGYEGVPLSIGEIRFLGDPVEGGTAAKVGITPAIQTASGYSFTTQMLREFHYADRWDKHVARYPDNIDLVQRLKLKIDLTRGSDVNDSPNGLPFIVRGYIHLSGEARRPVEIEPLRYRPT